MEDPDNGRGTSESTLFEPAKPIRVFVADDHPMFRRGVRAYLTHCGMEVVGEATNGQESVEGAVSLQPDVVLMDVRMPDMDGLEALRRIKREAPGVSVFILTAFESESFLLLAILNGASGFALKAEPSEKLRDLIEKTMRGEDLSGQPWWKPVLKSMRAHAAAEKGSHLPPSSLTAKELAILHYLAQGLGAVQIARLEGIASGTVRVQCHSAFRKLGVSDRLQAVLQGFRQGWLSIDDGRPED